jgi:hypothetical protein
MTTITINDDHPQMLKAAEATGLHGEALLEKALKQGLKALSQPKVAKVKAKSNPDSSPRCAPLTVDEIRRQFIENRKQGRLTINGFTPEFEAEVLAGKNDFFKVQEGSGAEIIARIKQGRRQ